MCPLHTVQHFGAQPFAHWLELMVVVIASQGPDQTATTALAVSRLTTP